MGGATVYIAETSMPQKPTRSTTCPVWCAHALWTGWRRRCSDRQSTRAQSTNNRWAPHAPSEPCRQPGPPSLRLPGPGFCGTSWASGPGATSAVRRQGAQTAIRGPAAGRRSFCTKSDRSGRGGPRERAAAGIPRLPPRACAGRQWVVNVFAPSEPGRVGGGPAHRQGELWADPAIGQKPPSKVIRACRAAAESFVVDEVTASLARLSEAGSHRAPASASGRGGTGAKQSHRQDSHAGPRGASGVGT
jgi:hypothetical protein